MTDSETERLRSEIVARIGLEGQLPSAASFGQGASDADRARETSFAALLENFVHLEFTEDEAIAHWVGIERNANLLAAKLGQSVGIHTAIVDYFTRERRLLNSPLLIEISSFRQTEQFAMIDGLTGIFNRRYMETMLKKEYTRSERYGKSFSVCLIDIDDFKRVNDTKGHPFGDLVLRELAALLKDSVREEDIVCRYGGEEFLIIIPETDVEGAEALGKRIRARMKQAKFFAETGITFSAGSATFPACARDVETLIRAADTALYQAKYSGKDRIVAAMPERRKYGRIPETWVFDIRDPKTPNGQTGIVTHNISLGGIQFESTRRYAIKSRLHMVFSCEGGKRGGVEADGFISWVRKNPESFLYGVTFSGVPEDLQAQLIDSAKYASQAL